MERGWEWNGDLMSSLKGFSEKVVAWNRDVFASILRRKIRVKSRMEGVTKAMDVSPNVGLIKLERILKREWMEILLQEEVLWVQKSRVNWLCFGDRNRKFFHTSSLSRHRRNKIHMLQNEERVFG